MNTFWMQLLIGGMAAFSIGYIAWYCGRLAMDITYVTLADGRRQERRLPFLYRLILPFSPNIQPLFRSRRYDRLREKVRRDLVSAGFDGLLTTEEFLSLKLLQPLILAPLLFGLYHVSMMSVPGRFGGLLMRQQYGFGLLVALFYYVEPMLWLRGSVRSRHRMIERALPFVLDLLTLSVEAGLDFMTAIKRIIDRRAIDPLGEELIRMFREVQLGKTRREALRDMSERSRQTDLRSVINALIQADELGVSIGSILRIQSDQMRIRRFQNAEKIANEAPVKMLFPLIAFIFPAVFIVLLGPIILQIMRQGIFH